MPHRFKYKSKFESIVCASSVEERKLLFSKASLDSLKSIIPANVDLDQNIDLLGVAFNAAVINRFNKNGDGVCSSVALAFKQYFIHKPTNIEHKKTRIVGHIINSAFSSIGDNRILSDDEVRGGLDPFNICLAAVVYRSVDKVFAKALIDSNDPKSPIYQKISASWEIGFSDFYIALGSDNLKDAEIITDPKQIEEFKPYLRSFDGSGMTKDGVPIYRLVTGRVFPLGIGFTTNPAADVQGVIVPDDELELDDPKLETDESAAEASSIIVNSIDFLSKHNKIISQNKIQPVNLINTTKNMDLNELLKEIKAALNEKQPAVAFSDETIASVAHKIADSIRAKNDEYKAQLALAEKAKTDAAATSDKVRSDLDLALAKLNTLESAVKAKAAQEVFSARMAALDVDFDFDDSDRVVLAKDLNELDSTDEAFASYKVKLASVYQHKSKANKVAQEKAFQDRLEAELVKRVALLPANTAVASATPTVDVAKALANTVVSDSTIVASTAQVTSEKVSWKDKFKEFEKSVVVSR